MASLAMLPDLRTEEVDMFYHAILFLGTIRYTALSPAICDFAFP